MRRGHTVTKEDQYMMEKYRLRRLFTGEPSCLWTLHEKQQMNYVVYNWRRPKDGVSWLIGRRRKFDYERTRFQAEVAKRLLSILGVPNVPSGKVHVDLKSHKKGVEALYDDKFRAGFGSLRNRGHLALTKHVLKEFFNLQLKAGKADVPEYPSAKERHTWGSDRLRQFINDLGFETDLEGTKANKGKLRKECTRRVKLLQKHAKSKTHIIDFRRAPCQFIRQNLDA